MANNKLEGPNDDSKSLFPSGGAGKLPTKDYPSSQPPKSSKGTDMDSPAPKKGYC